MKKFLKNLFIAISLSLVFFPIITEAQSSDPKEGGYGLKATSEAVGEALPEEIMGEASVEGVVGVIVQAILGLVGIVFFILIFWSGINWMTAQGNSEKIDKAKETIQGAAIGLVIVLAAFAITNFVFDSLTPDTGTTTTSTTP